MTTIPKHLPFGRLSELRQHPDAQLIALKHGRAIGTDTQIKRYASRIALEAFLKNPGEWHALVKTPTHPNMLIYPAFQKSDETIKLNP